MQEPIEYTIDVHNRIVRVCENWQRFYLSNGGAGDPKTFCGKDLLECIVGDEIRMLYSTLIGYVRTTQKAVSFPFCCNSPELRRDLVMSILPQPDGSITFFNIIQHTVPWSASNPKPTPQKYDNPLLLCSWCNRIKADTWMDLGTAIQQFGLFESNECPPFKHGICPPCQSRILTSLVQSEAEKLDGKPPVKSPDGSSASHKRV